MSTRRRRSGALLDELLLHHRDLARKQVVKSHSLVSAPSLNKRQANVPRDHVALRSTADGGGLLPADCAALAGQSLFSIRQYRSLCDAQRR